MYIILPIALILILLTWPVLRKFTKIWVTRPCSFIESIIAGIAAWLFIFSLLLWFVGIALTLHEFLTAHKPDDIWALIFSVLITGYATDFVVRSRSEMGIDDTQDFLKEAIQFRRSAQHRLDLLSLMQQRKISRDQSTVNAPESRQRARLQANLSKEKEFDNQIALLREGTSLDISEVWRSNTKMHSVLPLYEKVEEARIEPTRKRFSIFIDLPELNETQLKDETTVLRFNRQVYDFLQSLNSEPWIKPYLSFFESYYLMCRATRINKDGEKNLYPFMKVGVLVSELRKLEGSYFNPRKLSEITALAFNNGAQV